MAAEFVHLHVHTQFSFLVSTAKLGAIVDRTQALGMRAVAMTDHANMFGAVRHYKRCRAAGLQPILGCELNVARDDGADDVEHLVLLAATQQGYKNLIRLVSLGYTEPAIHGIPSVRLSRIAESAHGLVALFHLERDELDAVLRLFDGPVFGARSTVVFDLLDATSMLWRLHLRGVDVSDRWDAVADLWLPIAGASDFAFNDLHAMMAFVGSDRHEARELVFEAQRAALQRQGDNVTFVREVGQAATRAVAAFGDGDYTEAARLLRPIRSYHHRFGGSNAQRDVIDLTLIEAAILSGDHPLAQALAAERVARRPESRPALRFVERVRRIASPADEELVSEPAAA